MVNIDLVKSYWNTLESTYTYTELLEELRRARLSHLQSDDDDYSEYRNEVIRYLNQRIKATTEKINQAHS